jgi:hypothetical protein
MPVYYTSLYLRSSVLVLDPGNRRISRFRLAGGELSYDDEWPANVGTARMCAVRSRPFVNILRNGLVIHEFGSDGLPSNSFGPVASPAGLESLGTWRASVESMLASGLILCIPEPELVVAASTGLVSSPKDVAVSL